MYSMFESKKFMWDIKTHCSFSIFKRDSGIEITVFMAQIVLFKQHQSNKINRYEFDYHQSSDPYLWHWSVIWFDRCVVSLFCLFTSLSYGCSFGMLFKSNHKLVSKSFILLNKVLTFLKIKCISEISILRQKLIFVYILNIETLYTKLFFAFYKTWQFANVRVMCVMFTSKAN